MTPYDRDQIQFLAVKYHIRKMLWKLRRQEDIINESDLKRALVKSIQAQGGIGQRIEDKFTVGWPDLILVPLRKPVIFAEAKIVKGLRLEASPTQEQRLFNLWRPPTCYSVMLGYHPGRERLYLGHHGMSIEHLPSIPKPARFDSADWAISELLVQVLTNRS